MAGLHDTDIRLDDFFQLTRAATGDAPLISGTGCLMQDIRLEAMTQAGELFYDPDYGWSLLDFLQSEDDDLLELEIQQRVREKLAKRPEIDVETISTTVTFGDDVIRIHAEFQFIDDSQVQTVDLNLDRVSVEVVENA